MKNILEIKRAERQEKEKIREERRYKCKNCCYNFTKVMVSKPANLKQLAPQLYLE